MDPMDDFVYPRVHSDDISTETGALRFRLMPTLQHMAAVTIASQFYANQYVWDNIAVLYDNQRYFSTSLFNPLISEITEQVRKLPLPDKLISRISYVASRLSLEIFKWMLINGRFDREFKTQNYLHCIQWTSSGKINDEKTTHVILSMENISEQYRKNAAEYYCFNLSGEEVFKHLADSCTNHDTYTWEAYYQLPDPRVIGELSIKSMINIGESALRRLWASLSKEKRIETLNTLRYVGGNMEHFCFLLSQMDEETQMNFFRRNYWFLSLDFFNEWLWQDFFLPIIVKILPLINGFSLEKALQRMANKTSDYFYNSKDKQIFINFLHLIKQNLDIFSIGQNISFEPIISQLFRGRSFDIIDLITSLIPSNKKMNTLDCIISIAANSAEDQSELLQFIVDRFFENREEIEEYFLKKDFHLNHVRKLIKYCHVERIETLIKIFLCDEAKINSMKSKILQENLAGCLDSLVANRKYVTLNKILSLCFTGNDQEILEYRTQIMRGLNPQALSYMIMNKGCLSALEDFFCFCFGKENGISIGRNQLLQDKEMLVKMSDHLLTYQKPSLIDEFLDWCFSSDVEGRDTFKKEWTEISTVHSLHEIYRSCYFSEDPKELLKGLNLPLQELHSLRIFCNAMEFPGDDKNWSDVSFHINQERRSRARESVHYDSLADLGLTLHHFHSDSDSDDYDTDSD